MLHVLFNSSPAKKNGTTKRRIEVFKTIRVYFINLWPQSRKEIDTIRLVGPKFDKFSWPFAEMRTQEAEEAERSEQGGKGEGDKRRGKGRGRGGCAPDRNPSCAWHNLSRARPT